MNNNVPKNGQNITMSVKFHETVKFIVRAELSSVVILDHPSCSTVILDPPSCSTPEQSTQRRDLY